MDHGFSRSRLGVTTYVQLLEKPGLRLELEVSVAKSEARSGVGNTGRTLSSMRKVFNYELKLDITSSPGGT